jgi:hypothetical protein
MNKSKISTKNLIDFNPKKNLVFYKINVNYPHFKFFIVEKALALSYYIELIWIIHWIILDYTLLVRQIQKIVRDCYTCS